jgi:hypothetical protein
VGLLTGSDLIAAPAALSFCRGMSDLFIPRGLPHFLQYTLFSSALINPQPGQVFPLTGDEGRSNGVPHFIQNWDFMSVCVVPQRLQVSISFTGNRAPHLLQKTDESS